jgi:hypothetical protein
MDTLALLDFSWTTTPTTYEPPRIELVLTSEELEREVLYAGLQSGVPF